MIFKREFLINKKALLIWIVVLGGLIFLMLSLYPEFAKQKESLDKLLKIYPEALLKAFDINRLSYSSILGFYAIEGYMIITLFGSIYSVILASNILSKEENEKTIEFLLSKPISRAQIVSQKLLAILVNIFILNAIISVLVFIGFKMSDSTFNIKTLALISLAPFLLHLTFALVAYFISTVVKKSRNILSISLGIVLVAYFFNVLSKISDKFENLKYITPFEYVNAADIVTSNSIKPLYLVIMFSVMIVSIILTYIVYQRKDITV